MIYVYCTIGAIILYFVIRGAVLLYDVFKYISEDEDDRYGRY
jgi:hypothetical protein